MLQLGQAFKFAGPVARSAGISFEQSGAAMALMGNAGIQAEMAGTALRGAITKLVNPSNEAATTMAELGISATDSEGRLRPLDEIIEQLAPHADNTGAIMQIFGQRAGPAMAALVSQGADALREMTTALEQSGGTAQEIADKKLAGLTGAWTKLKSATEGVFIEIGTRLSPVLERLAALLTDRVLPAVRGALEAFDRLSPGMQTAVIAATAVTAALGPLLIVVGGVAATLTPLLPALVALGKTKAVVAGLAAVKTIMAAVGITTTATWAAILGPISLVIAAIAAVYLAWKHWDVIEVIVGRVFSIVKTWLVDKFGGMVAFVKAALTRVIGFYARLYGPIFTAVRKVYSAIKTWLVDYLMAAVEQIKGAVAAVVGFFRRAKQEADTRRMREEVQAAADRFTEIGKAAKAVEDRLRGFGKRIKLNPAAFREMSARAAEMRAEVDRLGTGAPASLRRLEAALDTTRKEMGLTAQAATDAGAAVEDLGEAATAATAAQIEAAEMERKAAGERVKEAATAAQDEIDIAAAKRRAIVEHIQQRREMEEAGRVAATQWTTSFFDTLASAFEGGGGFAGAMKSLGSQGLGQIFSSITGGAGGGFTQALGKIFSGGGVLGKIGSIGTKIGGGIGKFLSLGLNGVPIVGPFLAAFGGPLLKGLGALGKKIGGVFTRLFGGPSEAELAGRQAWRSYADGLAAEANAEQIQQALGAGWANVEDAKAWIVLRDSVQKAGGSAAEAEALWTRWVRAITQGPEAVAAVTHELDGWRQKAGEVAQAETEIAARNKELAGSLAGLVEAGHAAFDPAQLDPYLSQMQELGLITAEEAASMRQLADDAHVDWRGMEAAAKQYGVGMKTVLDESGREVQVLDESLLGLGHAQAKLTDEGGQLASAWELLTDEGGHMQAAIEGMTDEAQVFVTRALEMGIALPAAMKPMLEAMVEQSRLTDQNGEKLEDLSGLTFADPIAAQFDRLADSIQMLIIALGGPSGVSQAVEDMVDTAGLEIQDLAGEWAGMTEDAKAQFGSFAAFVEDQALRQIASTAGVRFDEIAASWEAMTDEERAAFESFAAFLDEQALKKLVDDAGGHYDEIATKWEAMTKAQREAIGSFRAFVNAELAKINDRTVTVTTRHRTEGSPSGGDEPGFGAQHGTPFRDFGRGTPGMLHGLERVMTAMEGRGIKAALGRITGGLAAIADLSGVRSLATGGLVTRPMIAQLHPSEAVVPLDRMAEFGGGRRVEAKLDQLHQDFALLLDEFRHGLDPRRRARAVVAAAALSTT